VIYVPLVGEGTHVWRPVAATHVGDNRYQIMGMAPADEHWQFSRGQVVRCEERALSGGECLVAVELANKQ